MTRFPKDEPTQTPSPLANWNPQTTALAIDILRRSHGMNCRDPHNWPETCPIFIAWRYEMRQISVLILGAL